MKFVIFVVYVDNFLLLSEDYESLCEVTSYFEIHYEIRTTEKIDKFLGFTLEDTGGNQTA